VLIDSGMARVPGSGTYLLVEGEVLDEVHSCKFMHSNLRQCCDIEDKSECSLGSSCISLARTQVPSEPNNVRMIRAIEILQSKPCAILYVNLCV
jgi:hypothetical protein